MLSALRPHVSPFTEIINIYIQLAFNISLKYKYLSNRASSVTDGPGPLGDAKVEALLVELEIIAGVLRLCRAPGEDLDGGIPPGSAAKAISGFQRL